MLHPVDARRRWFGTFYLVVAGGMLVWGQTVLNAHLQGKWYLIYWLVCFLFTALALLTAFMDIRAMRKQLREERRRLIQSTIAQVQSKNHEQNDRKPPAV